MAQRHRRREQSRAEQQTGEHKGDMDQQQWQTALFHQRRKSRQQLKVQQEQHEADQYSFRPKVNSSSKESSSLPKEQKRYERLYNQSKNKRQHPRVDRQQKEYESQ